MKDVEILEHLRRDVGGLFQLTCTEVRVPLYTFDDVLDATELLLGRLSDTHKCRLSHFFGIQPHHGMWDYDDDDEIRQWKKRLLVAVVKVVMSGDAISDEVQMTVVWASNQVPNN